MKDKRIPPFLFGIVAGALFLSLAAVPLETTVWSKPAIPNNVVVKTFYGLQMNDDIKRYIDDKTKYEDLIVKSVAAWGEGQSAQGVVVLEKYE